MMSNVSQNSDIFQYKSQKFDIIIMRVLRKVPQTEKVLPYKDLLLRSNEIREIR